LWFLKRERIENRKKEGLAEGREGRGEEAGVLQEEQYTTRFEIPSSLI